MAKIKNYIGELSGKLGGYVFARNKGGSYVRAFTTPTNPNTLAQSQARAVFGSSVSAYHGLTDFQKQNFNSFAANFFKPKFPKAGVSYSGFNAYVSLRNELENIYLKSEAATITGVTFTPTDVQPSNLEAPSFGLSGNIQIANVGPGGGPGVSSLIVSNIGELNSASISITFRTSSMMSPTNPPIFTDPVSGKKLGIGVMMSLPMTQSEQFTKSPNYTLLGCSKLINVTASTVTDNQLIFEIPISTTKLKSFPQLGDVVTITAFLFDETGQTFMLGSGKTQVVD